MPIMLLAIVRSSSIVIVEAEYTNEILDTYQGHPVLIRKTFQLPPVCLEAEKAEMILMLATQVRYCWENGVLRPRVRRPLH